MAQKTEAEQIEQIKQDRIRRRFYDKWDKYSKDNKKNTNRKRYALFSYDKYGNIVGFCNDSFAMTNRYGSVHLWDAPPSEHNRYFNPEYYFIVCITREYPDIRMYRKKNGKLNHTFKGNYTFETINPETGEWATFKDNITKELVTVEEGRKIRQAWIDAKKPEWGKVKETA